MRVIDQMSWNLGCWWSLARTIFRCTKPDQIHFTMDENLDFIENLKTRFSPRLPDLPMRAMRFWNLWSLGYCRIPITLWHFEELWRFQDFFIVTSIEWNFMKQKNSGPNFLIHYENILKASKQSILENFFTWWMSWWHQLFPFPELNNRLIKFYQIQDFCWKLVVRGPGVTLPSRGCS